MRKKGKKYMSDAQRYQYLRQQLNLIKSKLRELSDVHSELKYEIGETILINDKIIDEGNLNSIINNNKEIINEINNSIIPVVESNMNN